MKLVCECGHCVEFVDFRSLPCESVCECGQVLCTTELREDLSCVLLTVEGDTMLELDGPPELTRDEMHLKLAYAAFREKSE